MPVLKKILCAIDLSEQSESVAEYAVMLARLADASIVAVYAAPTLTQYTGFQHHRQFCGRNRFRRGKVHVGICGPAFRGR